MAAAVGGQTSIFDGDVISGGAGNDIFVIAGLNETGIVQSQFVPGTVPQLSAVVGTDEASFNASASTFGFIPFGSDAAHYNGAVNVDTITDFNVGGDDTLGLFASVFNGSIPAVVGTGDFITFNSGEIGAVGILDQFAVDQMGSTDIRR